MRHVSDWTLDDGSLMLNFSDEVRGVFERHVQVGDLPESGGVLLGTVHENGLLVTLATTPSRLDRQLRSLFERLPFGHRAVANRLWRSTGGTTRYIGEWHTHPLPIGPSTTDVHASGRLAVAGGHDIALLVLALGTRGWSGHALNADPTESIETLKFSVEGTGNDG